MSTRPPPKTKLKRKLKGGRKKKRPEAKIPANSKPKIEKRTTEVPNPKAEHPTYRDFLDHRYIRVWLGRVFHERLISGIQICSTRPSRGFLLDITLHQVDLILDQHLVLSNLIFIDRLPNFS